MPLSMPDRTLSVLSILAGACVCAYVVLIVITVTFATMQTELALSVRTTESSISQLETRYYNQVGVISDTDPHTMNLGKPARVTYAPLAETPSLSVR